jgi:adenylate kinase family enzyme
MAPDAPQRIQILGNSGGGKSTLARQLGDALDLPVIHLDRVFWKPNWVESPRDEFDAKVLELAQGDRWVIDGNYSRTLPARIERADLIIWIDVSRPRALWRVAKRAITHYCRTRADMGDDCPEHIDWGFFAFVWNYPNRRGADHRQMTDDARAAGKWVEVLNTGREVREFARSFGVSAADHSATASHV